MGTRIKRRQKYSFERRQGRVGYIFTLPFIIGLALIFFPNMIKTVVFSLSEIKMQSGEGTYHLIFHGLEYYKNALTVNPRFIVYLGQSVAQLCTDLPVILIFSLFMAVLLNQKFKGRIVVRAVFFIPVILATGIIASVEDSSAIMSLTAGTRGEQVAQTLGTADIAQFESILTSLKFNDTLLKIIVSAIDSIQRVIRSSGVQIFILMAGLQEISPSLYEASEVEGCSSWESFWKITFPLISPQLVVSGVYSIVDIFANPVSDLIDYLDELAFTNNQYGLSTAMYLCYFAFVGVILALLGIIASKVVFYND